MLAGTRRCSMLAGTHVEAIVPVTDLERAVAFYQDVLGLEIEKRIEMPPNDAVRFRIGDGTLAVYQSVGAGQSRHTLLGFIVDDIEATMNELRGRGVVFEEYDMPGFTTTDGIVDIADERAAWFKDPDGNILSLGQTVTVPAAAGTT
jgi:catechol 2,3-dioxygenase-like lactoylglutathione lyase family enzyme